MSTTTTSDVFIQLLRQLVSLPSFSGEEAETALALSRFLGQNGIGFYRTKNNVWTVNRFFDPKRPTILLNSHHDTVRPNAGYTRDPFSAKVSDGKLFGLGSNDAGGSLVALLACFMHFYPQEDLAYNLLFAATAEEEISGENGIALLLSDLPEMAFGIVGEPTGMQPAIAEKGLIVLECTAHGIAGHAAREEGENAIYKALPDIEWFRTYRFPKVSTMLGSVKMTVSAISGGLQHNVVPDTCRFTVDIRTTDAYTHEELIAIIREQVDCEVIPRSLRLNPSSIDLSHAIVRSAAALGLHPFGSPTLSDQALLPFPTLKMGPGDSARSHTADEYIHINEVEEAIALYIRLLTPLLNTTIP
jgi:acetylornithine deacetylase